MEDTKKIEEAIKETELILCSCEWRMNLQEDKSDNALRTLIDTAKKYLKKE
jgi:hypothetical protein